MASRVVGCVGVTAAIIYSASFLHKATCAHISPSKNRNLSKILLITDECVPTNESRACARHGLYPLLGVTSSFSKRKTEFDPCEPRPHPRDKSGTILLPPRDPPVNIVHGNVSGIVQGIVSDFNPFEHSAVDEWRCATGSWNY